MATSYTGDPFTEMTEQEAKALFDGDFRDLVERIKRLKEQIGGREGAREVSMTYSKLQEAQMWYEELKKIT